MFRDHTEEGVGVDVALECVGLEASLNACAKAVRRQGKVVQTGLHMKPASIDAMLWALKDITVEATWCYPVQIWPRMHPHGGAGTLPVEKIVTAQIAPTMSSTKGFEALLDNAVQPHENPRDLKGGTREPRSQIAGRRRDPGDRLRPAASALADRNAAAGTSGRLPMVDGDGSIS